MDNVAWREMLMRTLMSGGHEVDSRLVHAGYVRVDRTFAGAVGYSLTERGKTFLLGVDDENHNESAS